LNHTLSLKSLFGRDDLFLPDLERNIAKVLPTALSLFGVDYPSKETLTPFLSKMAFWKELQGAEISNVILIILDALGLEQLLTYSTLFKKLYESNGIILSSVFPTITSTCIPSLRLGKMPVEHGVLGHKIYFSEVGNVIDTLTLEAKEGIVNLTRAGVDVKNWLWCDFPIKDDSNIEQIDFIESHIANSGLSHFLTKKAYTIGYFSLVDCFAAVKRVLQTPSNKKRLLNIYMGSIDAISHRYTNTSFELQTEIELIEHAFLTLLRDLEKKISSKTAVFITSDHGQEILEEQKTIFISDDAEDVLNGLIRFRGRSGRVLHLYPKEGMRDEVVRWCEEEIGDAAVILTPEQYPLLMGQGARHSQVIERLGAVQVILGAHTALYFKPSGKFDPLYNLGLNATHGSLSKAELVVPLIAASLADFF